MTTEIWISSRRQISEATCTALQEALEEDEKKDTPSLARKIWRKYIDLAQKQGSWASITFRDQYMPQMVPMSKASWERASFNSTKKEAAAANWAGGRKATLLTGLN